jgi:hypothetical protein
MKKLFLLLPIFIITGLLLTAIGCGNNSKVTTNTTALDEQVETEKNQKNLLAVQPPPKINWSMERDNLIKRFKMMNDRTIFFYMYVFNEGVADPIGYYQVNKVSSVNSQLTNTMQIIAVPMSGGGYTYQQVPSPAEDGSYGTNGDGVFGFTPEDIYIEHNMKYIVASVPLNFTKPVNRLAVVSVKDEQDLKILMDKIK